MPDSITVKMDQAQKSFTPCPAGSHHAVCVDVIDLGWTADQYKDQPIRVVRKAALVFQTDEENAETGKRYEPSVEFTIGQEFEDGRQVATFGPRSKLRQFLTSWRGKEYGDAEAAEGAPLHKTVGVNAVLGILQRTSVASGRTYAVIDTVSPTLKTLPKLVPHNYERSEHWEKRKAEYAEKLAAYRATHTGGAVPNFEEPPPGLEPDDDLPF
jgi:hypothetical protein